MNVSGDAERDGNGLHITCYTALWAGYSLCSLWSRLTAFAVGFARASVRLWQILGGKIWLML